MIRGIGIDIIKIDRINEDHIKKILSAKEKEIYEGFKGTKRKREYAAGRFAAKEAITKCFKRFIPYSEITILNGKNGDPYVEESSLKYIFSKFGGDGEIYITLSHERDYAVAAAIVIDKVDKWIY